MIYRDEQLATLVRNMLDSFICVYKAVLYTRKVTKFSFTKDIVTRESDFVVILLSLNGRELK